MTLPSPFPGFPPEALQFFRGLARNNKRDWFLPRKPLFEERVKKPMRQLVDALNLALHDFAPEYETDPDQAIFRIYRDIRFSKDKKPYKEHIAATFHRRGAMTHGQGGYYVAISHKEVAVGGGVYAPDPAQLLAIRQRIAERHDEFRRILAARPLPKLLGNLEGAQLSRVPRGFPADHPGADLLRFRYYILYKELPPSLATSPLLYKAIVERFRVMVPFLEFLTVSFAAQQKKPDVLTMFA
ncbi:MAG TPA: DUF2461 domain-containing protein [Candidatus Dormibacteraeota bacterium]|nr:DUF2461 domain-containing protein [Candidatus Dormibacteraeota bacterium]